MEEQNGVTPPPVGRMASQRQTLQMEGLPTLQALVDYLSSDRGDKVPRLEQWDTLLIGDGSGSGWDLGAGWACVLIDKYSGARKLFCGALNTGTVSLAEIFPYLHAMCWYAAKDGPGSRRRQEAVSAGRALNIHVVTDSQYVAQAGNSAITRKQHKELWAAFDAYRLQGYQMIFHHVPREVINLNVFVDAVSRQARLALAEVYQSAVAELQRNYPGVPSDVTIYDFSA
jgi:ribonuclease HI